MYSIIIKLKTSDSCCSMNTSNSLVKDRWKYLTNSDGSIYKEDDVEKVKQKCLELLDTYPLSSIKVVQNKDARASIYVEGAPDPHVSILPEVTVDDNGKILMVIEGDWGVGEVEVLPAVTIADDGKILKVENGEWTVAEETVNTDSKVTQTNVTTNGEYRVLLSKQTDDEEHTDTVLKSGQLIYNPYENHINVIKNTDNLYTESNMSDDSLGVFNWDKTNNIRKSLRVEYDDITLSNQTWDSTHTSLKDAIAAAASGGSGGTTVVANPSETATAELNKLKVDNTVYEIPNEIPDDFKINLECQYGTGTNIFITGSTFATNDKYILVPKTFGQPNDILTKLRIFMLNKENMGDGTTIIGGPQTTWYEGKKDMSGTNVLTKDCISFYNNNDQIIAQIVTISGTITTMTNQLNANVKSDFWCIGKIQAYELTSTIITAQQVNDMWNSVFNG